MAVTPGYSVLTCTYPVLAHAVRGDASLCAKPSSVIRRIGLTSVHAGQSGRSARSHSVCNQALAEPPNDYINKKPRPARQQKMQRGKTIF
ncbi:hypothetical protein E5D57_009793 [Metarhizium anisopliae]|nr:hypothetical protein E5D57_009793 [Metarhizium anisopliae]